jgi:hypothetical protein
MSAYNPTEERAVRVLSSAGLNAAWVLDTLRAAGLRLADENDNELVCRWINVLSRAVPPDADTIIRTITRTIDGQSTSTTHWLDGLRSPKV